MSLPDHVSHSQLSSWMTRCQKAFQLERIQKAPALPAFWLLGGSAVHEVTEELDRRGLEFGLDPAELNVTLELRELFESNFDKQIKKAEEASAVPKEDWLAAGFRPKQDEAYWRANGPQMVGNWLTWRARTGWEIAELDEAGAACGGVPAIELALDVTSELNSVPRSILGAPDRVMVLPNGELVVVDVKSGSTTPKTVLQQGLYATMLEREFGVRPRYGTFVKVGVKAGGVHTALTPLEKYDERYFQQLFDAFRAQVETGTFLPNVGDMCDRCGVAASCYAVGGTESDKYDPLNPNYHKRQSDARDANNEGQQVSEQIEGPDAPFTVTLKQGAGFESPWLVLRGQSAEDVVALLGEAKLNELPRLISEFAADFRGETGAAAQGAPARSSGSPSRSQAAPRRAAAPQQSAQADVELHPESLTCHCGGAVQYKKITAKASGKTFEMWVCPNQRSKGDGHFSEFIN